MILRRVLWLLLGVAVIAAIFAVRAHTQADPQCDVGFVCANVDQVSWTGTDPDVGGLCVKTQLKADVTTMFSQSEKWGFRRASSQTSTLLPTSAEVHVTKSCTDPAPGVFTEAWIRYSIATDRDALAKADSEAARVLGDPTRATVVRGKDRNWLFTVVKVPTDTGTVPDAFAPELLLNYPPHWSKELGELRLPCVWVSATGSVAIDGKTARFEPNKGAGPTRVCAAGQGDSWPDTLDGFFDNSN